jgi:GntR family transcriptional regulator / MocR family aminotransferase
MQLTLDGEGSRYRQLYRALRAAILSGALRAGTRLPATRALAAELAVSRNTVLQAYDQLLAEGYVAARTGSGTYVSRTLPDDLVSVRPAGSRTAAGKARAPRLTDVASRVPHGAAKAGSRAWTPRASGRWTSALPRVSAAAARMVEAAPGPGISWRLSRRTLPYDFRYGEPAYDDLPLATWCRLLARRARRISARRLAYADAGGAPELRQALAEYLPRARGVLCDPERIVVVYGTQQAIDLTARVLVDPGDRVAIEEPHYPGIALALVAAGAELVSVPVDEAGLTTDELEGVAGVRLVCVTPSHQFPTGAIMPLGRRLELLGFAERRGALVLEDDYDSEFRFDGRPIECLQGLDRGGRVIYVGSASKLLFPALRIGWLVLPEELVRPFLLAKALADTGTPSLEQLVLADLIAGGHLERHVRRSRTRNAARRAALLQALDEHLGERAVVSGTDAGLHVLLWLRGFPAGAVPALRRECAALGVGVYPVAPYYRRPPGRAGLILGYASLTEAAIREGVRRLGRAYRALAARR